MTKLIYLEGPDHSGKTTLIEQIRTKEDLFYHNGVYSSPFEAYSNYMSQMSIYKSISENDFFDGVNTIVDRGIFAEEIYGSVIRNNTIKPNYVQNVINHLERLNVTFILCLPPFEVAFEGWKSRIGEEYVKDEDKYKKIYEGYYLLSKRELPFKTIMYDYTQTGEYNANSK